MIRTTTLAALAALLTAPAMAACPAITSDTDPCWAAQVIQSEKGRPAAADEWTPESFARTFGQTIVSLTDAGQRVQHHCNPTFCEDVITDGKIVAYRDTSAGKPDLSSVCYAVQGSPESYRQMFVQQRRENTPKPIITMSGTRSRCWCATSMLPRPRRSPSNRQPMPHTENKEHEQRTRRQAPAI